MLQRVIRACCVPGRWCRSVRLNAQWCSEGDEGKVGALSMSTLTAPSISHLIIRLVGSLWRGHLEGPTLDGDDWTRYLQLSDTGSFTHPPVGPNLHDFLFIVEQRWWFKKCLSVSVLSQCLQVCKYVKVNILFILYIVIVIFIITVLCMNFCGWMSCFTYYRSKTVCKKQFKTTQTHLVLGTYWL